MTYVSSGEVSIWSFDANPVRGATLDGEVWFVLADVCKILDIGNPRDAAGRLEPDERDGVGIPDAMGRVQQTTVISESGLYTLTMTSRKENARRFRRWVTSEVLPSIRKTGAYAIAPPAPAVPQTLAQALRLAADQADRIEAQDAALAIAEPKAAALDRIEGAEGSMCITAAAKVLKVAPRQLHDWLRQHGWTYRRAHGQAVLAYQDKVASGLLEHKPTTLPRADRPDKVVEQVLVTAKGLTRLAREFGALPDRLGPPSARAAAPLHSGLQ